MTEPIFTQKTQKLKNFCEHFLYRILFISHKKYRLMNTTSLRHVSALAIRLLQGDHQFLIVQLMRQCVSKKKLASCRWRIAKVETYRSSNYQK